MMKYGHLGMLVEREIAHISQTGNSKAYVIDEQKEEQ